jgi:hypothetical protein
LIPNHVTPGALAFNQENYFHRSFRNTVAERQRKLGEIAQALFMRVHTKTRPRKAGLRVLRESNQVSVRVNEVSISRRRVLEPWIRTYS